MVWSKRQSKGTGVEFKARGMSHDMSLANRPFSPVHFVFQYRSCDDTQEI